MSNLLPVEQKNIITGLYRNRFFTIAFFCLALLVIIASVGLVPSLFLSKNNEQSLSAKYVALSGQETQSIQDSLSNSISDINKKLAVFPVSAPTSPLLSDFISPVLTAKTSKIHISDFSYTLSTDTNSAAVVVSGVSDDRVSLLSFVGKLKTLDGFSNVDVPISSFIKESNVPFSATMSVVINKKTI